MSWQNGVTKHVLDQPEKHQYLSGLDLQMMFVNIYCTMVEKRSVVPTIFAASVAHLMLISMSRHSLCAIFQLQNVFFCVLFKMSSLSVVFCVFILVLTIFFSIE